MQTDGADTLATADALARVYLDVLAQEKGCGGFSMSRGKNLTIDEFLDAATVVDGKEGLRVDQILAAIVTARCIASEPNLAGRLRRGEDAVVVIATHQQDWVDLVEDIIRDCATPKGDSKKMILALDGNERSHVPHKNNSHVYEGLGRGGPVVGIAPDPKRHLPSALLRTAECRLQIRAVDGWVVGLLLEAVTGKPYDGPIDEAIVRSCELSDFSLAIRRNCTPEQCLSRLAELVTNKLSFTGDGPRLEDLHGYGEAAKWGFELIEDLKQYRTGQLRWNEIANRNLLLSSDPGLGKTSFAAALARSLGVQLVSTSVADWNATEYLSGTLQAMKKAFSEARLNKPAILFIDEFDGISSRSTLRGDYVEYWTQVVNLLLELMSNEADLAGVILIAATNHPEKIDPALLRAGRMDRHIRIERPTAFDLAKIFRFCIGQDALVGVDTLPLGFSAAGSTGADVTNWVRRARAVARREGAELSLDHILAEIRGSTPVMSTALRRRVAVHEAGHCIVARSTGLGLVVAAAITHTGGRTEVSFDSLTDEGESKVSATLAFLLAGRAAEQLVLGSCGMGSGGGDANNDLKQATRLAIDAESVFGFGKTLGLMHVQIESSNLLPTIPGLLDAVRSRLEEAMATAMAILASRISELSALAEALDRNGYLSYEAIEAIIVTAGSAQAA